MNHHEFDSVNDSIERLDCLLIAAERWGGGYNKDHRTHVRIIRVEALLAKQIRGLFKDFARQVGNYVQIRSVPEQVIADVTVEVIINDQFFNELDNTFMRVVFDTIATATTVGALAGESIYNIPLGIQSTDKFIQELTTRQVAWLVGKKVTKDGSVIDNPNAVYRISNKTRNDINAAIKTSIAVGETKGDLIDRLARTVANPRRAAAIAQTESVNAYGNGLLGFGKESGATGKEWQDVGAEDVCAENSAQGIIPLNGVFVSGDQNPAAHVGCRCGLRIVYSNEYQPK